MSFIQILPIYKKVDTEGNFIPLRKFGYVVSISPQFAAIRYRPIADFVSGHLVAGR